MYKGWIPFRDLGNKKKKLQFNFPGKKPSPANTKQLRNLNCVYEKQALIYPTPRPRCAPTIPVLWQRNRVFNFYFSHHKLSHPSPSYICIECTTQYDGEDYTIPLPIATFYNLLRRRKVTDTDILHYEWYFEKIGRNYLLTPYYEALNE